MLEVLNYLANKHFLQSGYTFIPDESNPILEHTIGKTVNGPLEDWERLCRTVELTSGQCVSFTHQRGPGIPEYEKGTSVTLHTPSKLKHFLINTIGPDHPETIIGLLTSDFDPSTQSFTVGPYEKKIRQGKKSAFLTYIYTADEDELSWVDAHETIYNETVSGTSEKENRGRQFTKLNSLVDKINRDVKEMTGLNVQLITLKTTLLQRNF